MLTDYYIHNVHSGMCHRVFAISRGTLKSYPPLQKTAHDASSAKFCIKLCQEQKVCATFP